MIELDASRREMEIECAVDLRPKDLAKLVELRDLRDRAEERLREVDRLRFGLEEIAAAEPQPDEDDDLPF